MLPVRNCLPDRAALLLPAEILLGIRHPEAFRCGYNVLPPESPIPAVPWRRNILSKIQINARLNALGRHNYTSCRLPLPPLDLCNSCQPMCRTKVCGQEEDTVVRTESLL